MVGKKIGFDFSKYQIYFVVCRKKKVVFGDKYLALCLFHKINFFFYLKNIRSIFMNLKKLVFITEKIRSVL